MVAKKSQSLPLNVIVIAIIVIVVLVMVVVFFTNKFSSTGNNLDEQKDLYTSCRIDNPALSEAYSEVHACDSTNHNPQWCNYDPQKKEVTGCAEGYVRVFGVHVDNGICCGKKK